MTKIVDLRQINNFEKYSSFIQQAEVIGKGAHGKVYKAFVNNIFPIGPIAIKLIELDENRYQDEIKALEDENNFLMSINHINIMKVFFHFARIDINSKERQYYIGMEYAPYDLASLLKKKINFSTEEIANMAQQLQSGLSYLQTKNIVHRDLKPANILKSEDGTYKLCDFSEIKFSNDTINTITQTFHGTATYLDPKLYQVYLQILEDKKYNRPLNYEVNYNSIKADVFSFGLIILQCLMGCSEQQLMGANQSEEGIKYLISRNFTDAYKWFLKLCLNYDEKQRWSFEQMNKIFKLNLIEAAYQLEIKDIQLLERDNLISEQKSEIIELTKEIKELKQQKQQIDEYNKKIQSLQLELSKIQKEFEKKQEDFSYNVAQNLATKKKKTGCFSFFSRKKGEESPILILRRKQLCDQEIINLCKENQKLWENKAYDKRKASVKKTSDLTWDYYYYVLNDYDWINDDDLWNYDTAYKYQASYFSTKDGNYTYSFVKKHLPKALKMLQKLVKESQHEFKNCLKILHSNLWDYKKSLSQLTENN